MATNLNPIVPRSIDNAAKRVHRQRTTLAVATALSAALAAIGVVIGISMAVHRVVVPCADGHYFPQGTTDFRCFSHPHAGEGVSLAIIAALIGIGVGLVIFIAFELVAGTTPTSLFSTKRLEG